ncbi:hypothetical protein HanPSC8_Chr05g0188301 [Helianthus annuus]|nr:hypothetical protein HanPSC8_Chr05g0188301 [Helianthus annuus]
MQHHFIDHQLGFAVMAAHGEEIETTDESLVENITDKIHRDNSSPSLSDSESEKKPKFDDDDVKKPHDAPAPDSSLKSKSNRLFGTEKPVHQVFGGGKPADVILWRNKKISASVLAGATVIWVLFELLEYHLVTLLCHISILVFAILFLWSSAFKIINKSPPPIPKVRIPEDTVLQGIASGRDLKKFLAVIAGLWYEDEVDAFAEKAMIDMVLPMVIVFWLWCFRDVFSLSELKFWIRNPNLGVVGSNLGVPTRRIWN